MQLNFEGFPNEFPMRPKPHQHEDMNTKCKIKAINASNNTIAERQQIPGPFMQWIQTILGIRPTTTPKPEIPVPAMNCPECTSCGVPNNGTKIVGNEKIFS